ncbi:hypothetical protein Ahy_B06g080657 [Arachis hypogaea]|uniref:Protein FAR1-RELATED SEQUENCE n=1 Tax=Arachis hypogaea TaxID=3818 RepID=A0A444YIT9_ARAHY|nr:hypothetical protein Ahy_B06g080657 [Arachis hypogaea]
MNESILNQLNECDLDNSSKMYQFDETSCVVDEKFVPKMGMIFKTLEEVGKFYKHYSKLAGFSTKIRNTTRDGDKIKNQLVVCSREGRWKSKRSPTLKTNPSAGLNCTARIYVHIMKDVGLRTISKVVLNHSHPCCVDQAEMLKQHREFSIFVRRTIETHEKAGIRPSKTYKLFVAAAGSHRELGFIEKDIRNYITREVRNISEEADAKEFGKYLKLERFPHKVWSRRQQVAFRAVRGSPYIDSSLLGSPLLGRDEKHAKEREEQIEREFDAADFHTVIPCVTKSAIEAQFQRVYTHEKFREVQAQFRGKVNCITRSMHSTLGFTTYEVIEQISNSIFNKFVVTYNACHCLLVESRGILCRHSLSVLSFERVDNVTPKHILERWSKNIKRRHTHIKSIQDEPLLESKSKRFDELVFQSHNICEFASESKELTGILHRAFDKVMEEMEEYQGRNKGKSLLTHEEATLSNVNDLQSPPRVKTRGRPKNRLGSNMEKKISNAIKKRKRQLQAR